MVARTWWGATRADDAADYLDYLRKTGLAEYARVPGHRRTLTLRRIDRGRAEFLIVTLWDSMDAIHAFAGEQPEQAVVEPEAGAALVRFDKTVQHYEVLAVPSGS